MITYNSWIRNKYVILQTQHADLEIVVLMYLKMDNIINTHAVSFEIEYAIWKVHEGYKEDIGLYFVNNLIDGSVAICF